MVKADVKRDYYADLEVPITADTEEIKKQFRLLAKQYHPDRNPGHEVEVVPKFQAVQAAHEVLVDAAERAKYDAGRAKLARANNPPVPKETDPYNFKRPPARAATTAQAPPQFPFPPPPPPQQPRQRPAYTPQQAQPSAGAERFNAFTRANPQTWDRARFDDAARAEAARGFSNMRPQNPPAAPPRPPRPHPTAARPTATATSPEVPNAVPSTFPGLSRTASASRMYQGQPKEAPDSRTSAYSHVRGNRPPPATTQTYTPEAYMKQSPPQADTRPGSSHLRHVRSSDQGIRQPTGRPAYDRSSSRYASSNVGEKTNINGPALGRSTSVRNSPVGVRAEDLNSWNSRPHSHQGPPPVRHHSASPKIRPSAGHPAEFSSGSSSGSSDDERLNMNARPKVVPKPRVRINPGLDRSFPNTNYTKVVDQNNGQYTYPPPDTKGPTRTPFPDMTSPDDTVPPEPAFSNAEPTNFVPDPVFQAAKFSHEDWAERFKSTSPTKRGSTSRRKPMSKPDTSPDPMDIDPTDEKPPHTNGIDLNDLKNHAPFTSGGLEATEDLATHLPFDSRPAGKVNLERGHSRSNSTRLRNLALPRPPKEVVPPSDEELTQPVWRQYVEDMKLYMREWLAFENKMIAHFASRHEQVKSHMIDNWISIATDGPTAEQIEANGSGTVNGTPKAGYTAYMEWFEDDVTCHTWWETANNHHRKCLEDLGRLRENIKKQ